MNHVRGTQTWKKVYVLTPDNILYSEYLDYMIPITDKQEVNFETFEAADYSFGGYQDLKEGTKEIAVSTHLTQQQNWVQGYLESIKNTENKIDEIESQKELIMENPKSFIKLNNLIIQLHTIEEATSELGGYTIKGKKHSAKITLKLKDKKERNIYYQLESSMNFDMDNLIEALNNLVKD